MSYIQYKPSKRRAICPICGHKHESGEMVYTIPNPAKNANGGIAYVCEKHAELAGYHNEEVRNFCNPQNYRGKLGVHGLLFGIELEVINAEYPIDIDGIIIDSPENARAYIAAVWNLRWTRDSTVDAEGNMPPDTTMCGWRDRIGNTMKVFRPNHRWAGAHLTIGWSNGCYILNFEYYTSVRVLDTLAEVLINASTADREFIFGRDFTEYAQFTTGCYCHGDWANIRENGSIEFRLCHIDNVEQYLRGASFCAEIAKVIKNEETKASTDKVLKKKIQTLWNKTIRKEMAVDNRSVMTGTNRKRNVDKF